MSVEINVWGLEADRGLGGIHCMLLGMILHLCGGGTGPMGRGEQV